MSQVLMWLLLTNKSSIKIYCQFKRRYYPLKFYIRWYDYFQIFRKKIYCILYILDVQEEKMSVHKGVKKQYLLYHLVGDCNNSGEK